MNTIIIYSHNGSLFISCTLRVLMKGKGGMENVCLHGNLLTCYVQSSAKGGGLVCIKTGNPVPALNFNKGGEGGVCKNCLTCRCCVLFWYPVSKFIFFVWSYIEIHCFLWDSECVNKPLRQKLLYRCKYKQVPFR